MMSSTPRWQWWRMFRKVWIPTPCLEGSPVELGYYEGSMATWIGGRVAARWSDWTEALRETLPDGLPPATGQYLLAKRDLVGEFAAATGSTFCWVCRLTGYYKEHPGHAHKQFTDHRSFGALGIVMPWES